MVIPLFAGISLASAETAPKSCLEEDRGYKLINADGTIEPVRLYGAAVKKFADSNLNGQAPAQIQQFGVKTGDPREWARLFVMLCKQESGCRIARTYPDGSLEKFPSTPQGERSYGPLQFNIGEYGLSSWAMVNSPSCTIEAFIRVAQQNKLLNYFGSMQRSNEVMQHAGWFNRTVQPFADALTLVFDPNAKDNSATYRALTPYFLDPDGSTYRGGPFGMQTSSPNPVQGAFAANGAQSSQGAFASPGVPSQSQGGALTPTSVSPTTVSSLLTGGSQTIVSSTQVQTVFPTGVSALSIFVQPQNPRKGDSVLVSWTSVNMKSSCAVSNDGTQIGDGTEGTKRIVISSNATGNTTFVYTCIAGNGDTKTVSQTITPQ